MRALSRFLLPLGFLVLVLGALRGAEPAALTPAPTKTIAPRPIWKYEELRRFPAPEAGQGVVVDAEFFYAINNHALGKYRKSDGARVTAWAGPDDGPIIHLNAGFLYQQKLYGVHSNYPGVPMLSSIEIFDPATLRHLGTHSFGRMDGSFTWLDRHDDHWIACFVHYGNRAAEPNRDGSWTQILELDDAWRRTGGWALPPDLIERFGGRGYSASGGAFGPGGYLYLTGHDNTELYVMSFPEAGSVMNWVATIPFPSEGQAFSWDPSHPDLLYSVLKRTKEVIVGRVTIPDRK